MEGVVKQELKLGVFASGRGSNFEAILKAIDRGELDAQVVVVISSKSTAGALEIARQWQVPAYHISIKQFDSQAEFDDKLLSVLAKHEVEVIILAGYLKLLSPKFVRHYRHRILNIHPALLPSFGGPGMYGERVHQAVLDHGCKVSGVTVHLVDETYDTGPPVIQRCVPVMDDDTAETLAARVLKVEHKIYAEAIQLFAEGRITVQGRRVIIKRDEDV
jgi:phosphoribosylglycinamide formyltransferase-1